MFVEAKLVFRHYIPEDYSTLMFLAIGKYDVPYVYTIEGLRDVSSYIEANGYPVWPYIIDEGNPNIPNSTRVLASPHEIGWFDPGSHSDDLIDIEVKQFNDILEFDNGSVLIEVDDDTDVVVLFQGKVTLMYMDSLDDDDDDEDYEEEEEFNPDSEDYNQIY